MEPIWYSSDDWKASVRDFLALIIVIPTNWWPFNVFYWEAISDVTGIRLDIPTDLMTDYIPSISDPMMIHCWWLTQYSLCGDVITIIITVEGILAVLVLFIQSIDTVGIEAWSSQDFWRRRQTHYMISCEGIIVGNQWLPWVKRADHWAIIDHWLVRRPSPLFNDYWAGQPERGRIHRRGVAVIKHASIDRLIHYSQQWLFIHCYSVRMTGDDDLQLLCHSGIRCYSSIVANPVDLSIYSLLGIDYYYCNRHSNWYSVEEH